MSTGDKQQLASAQTLPPRAPSLGSVPGGHSTDVAAHAWETAMALERLTTRMHLYWDPARPQVPIELICAAITYLTSHAALLRDVERLNWVENQYRGTGCVGVQLLVAGQPRGEGATYRAAIDDAMLKQQNI